ncbi:hypothetical protein [Bradyrhizobium sp. BRP56]|uniref:hypothetical protein n=1 Tax=Bradyrhizobium sp. BRP56 TaxID=2793819 RepID=UPI001CD77B2F|nr:hypothetical protein [Bradyrhizobium sp. BRP56]MCA1395671.1 hypothetical protein [Bradyrhizobium sp. BRP56]
MMVTVSAFCAAAFAMRRKATEAVDHCQPNAIKAFHFTTMPGADAISRQEHPCDPLQDQIMVDYRERI